MDEFYYWDETIRKIVNANDIYIYGAGFMGSTLNRCLSLPPYSIKVKGFITGDNKDNPNNIEGIPVKNIDNKELDKDALILVALHEKNLQSALSMLSLNNFINVSVVSFDGDEWNHIRGNCIRANDILNDDCSFGDNNVISSINVYVVQSKYDKKVLPELAMTDYEIPIQVGKGLCQERLCSITDNDGDNISDKNKQYCELTALYWIWKHRKSSYIGLCHYRRRFSLSDAQIKYIQESNIDMVVTIPIINLDGVGKQYGLDHSSSDWDIMMDTISELSPEYYESAVTVQNRIYYYGYNMFIAKYEVLCDYCKWLFNILFEVERRLGTKEDIYQNRYIGFMAERLLNVYIVKHDLKMYIAEKHFFRSI